MGYVQPSTRGSTVRARTRVNGKLVSRSFPSQSAAWAWIEQVESGATLAHAPAAAPTRDPAAPLTLQQWYDDGGFVTAHLKSSTRATYAAILSPLLAEFGKRPIAEIRRAELQHWLLTGATKGARAKDRKAISVRHIAKVASAMFTAAMESGVIEDHPARRLKVPRETDPYVARFLTTEELLHLADCMDERYRAFTFLAGFGGLRAGEVFALRWANVDLRVGRLTINDTATEVAGRVIVDAAKTKASRRSFTLPRVATTALVTHRDGLRAARASTAPDAFVIPNTTGGVMGQRNFRRSVWAPAVAKASLGPLKPHELRHTAISLWIAAGMAPKEVSARAGHTSVAFTLDRYGHLYEESDEVGTALFDKFLTRES